MILAQINGPGEGVEALKARVAGKVITRSRFGFGLLQKVVALFL